MKEKNKLITARSQKDGIRFFSGEVEGLCVIETIDENGNVTSNTKFDRPDSSIKEFMLAHGVESKDIVEGLIITFVASIPGFLYIINTHYSTLTKWYMAWCVFGAIAYIRGLIGGLIALHTGEGKKIRRFHGAEHKTINAYEKYGHNPSYEEVKITSKYGVRCGTRKSVIKVITKVSKLIFVLKFVSKWSLFRLFFTAFIGEEVLGLIIAFSKIDMIFQGLFLSEPTDVEICVAQAGLTELLNAEKKYHEALNYNNN